MSGLHDMELVAVIAVVTALLRFLPFLIFGGSRQMPESIRYLSGVLPYAVMGMLVVYCLKDTEVLAEPHGIP